MPIVPSPLDGNKYIKNANVSYGTKGTAGVELNQALGTSTNRILRDPNAIASGNTNKYIAGAYKAASGEKSGGGGVGKMLGKSFLDALGNIGYIVGTPVRAVASVAKEGADLVTGGDASVKQLFGQVADRNFYPSTVIAKTGNKWVDGVIGLGVDVFADPTTYITFGASAFAGRTGRIALAAKAAEKDMIAQAPSLAAKIADGSIAARGEWALSDLERQVLNVPKGVRYQIGGQLVGKEGSAIRKGSEMLAEAVGGNWASVRSRMGDLPALKPLQELTTPKSVRSAGLSEYGRRSLDWAPRTARTTNEIIGDLASYSAASRGKAMGKMFSARVGAAGQQLAKDLSEYEANSGRKIVDVIEGVRPAFDAQEQDVANRVTQFLADTRAAGNDVTQKFATRRNVRAYDIAFLENYVPHSLSGETRAWLASKRWRGSQYETGIKNMLDQTPEEFISGPNVMRARKLKPKEKFLGVELVGDGSEFVSMKEINDISMNQLGFKWFEDDGATYLNSYINSVASQAKRVGFTDRLFDYGTDVVRAIDYKLIPDKKVIGSWRASVGAYRQAVANIVTDIGGSNKELATITRGQRNLAQRVVNAADRRAILTVEEIAKVTKNLETAKAKLAVAEQLAQARGGEIQAAFNTAVAPYKARLQAIEEALASGRQDEVIATMQLEEIHNKMFPKMKKRPSDPKQMAEQILAKSNSRTQSRLKALETRKYRLERKIGPKGKVGKALKETGVALETDRAELARITGEISNYEQLMKYQSEDFPDGYFVISEEDFNQATVNKTSANATYDFDPASQDYVFLAPDMSKWHILRPTDDIEDAIYTVKQLGNAFYEQLGDFGTTASFEGEAFKQLYDEALKGNPPLAMWGIENPEMDAILSEVPAVMARLNELRILERRGEDITGELEELVNGFLDSYADKVSAFFAKAENEGLDLSGYMGSADYVASNTISKVADIAEQSVDKPYSAQGKDIAGIYLPFSIVDPDIRMTGYDPDIENYLDISNTYLMNNGVDPVNGSMLVDPSDPIFQSIIDINTQGNQTFNSLLDLSEQAGLTQSVVAGGESELARLEAELASIKAEAGRTGKQAGGIKSGQSRLEAKVGSATEQYAKAQEIPVVNSKGETISVPKDVAEGMSTKVAKSIDKKTKALAKEMRDDPLMQAAAAEGKAVQKASATLDAKQALLANQDEWEATFGNAYRTDLQMLQEQLASKPTVGASAEIQLEWSRRTEQMFASLEQATLNPQQKQALTQVLTQLKGQEANLAFAEQYLQFGEKQLERALTGEIGGKLVADIKDGWAGIEALGVQMPPELRERLFGKIESLTDAKEWGKFRTAYMAYHRFFKITAMLTPGFIVRNSYTAAFNNFVAGVSLKETKAGIKFSSDVWRYGIDEALKRVPIAQRDLYEEAYRTVLATGGGQTADDFLYPMLEGRGSKWINSRPIKAWTKANESAEVAARMSLALSSLNRGLDFDATAAQIARYHFDYTDLSKLDEFAKQFIPFWIFATRNIPLQITNQIARPSMYRAYESAQRNFPTDEDLVLPPWLANRNPLGFGGGSVINPDLPQIDMADQLRMLSDPQRLASQLNPLIKLPIELMGSRQLATDTPFNNKPQEVRGPLDYPAALAGLLFGQTQQNASGDLVTSSKAAYAIPNLLPTLATLQRLVPQLGGKEAYVDRQSSSVLGALGVPWRGVSPQEQANTLTSRQFALKDYLSKLTQLGYLQPNNTRGGY
jgi:hypothetical protein